MNLQEVTLNSLDVNIAVLDKAGVIIHTNDAWRKFAWANGTPIEHNLVGDACVIHCLAMERESAEGDSVWRENFRQVLNGTLAQMDYEYACDSPAGKRWYRLHLQPLAQMSGLFIASHFDTSSTNARSLANELALCESLQHTHAVLENIVDGVITINEQGNIESFNRAASKIFGYTAAEVIHQSISILMPEPDRSRHNQNLLRYQKTDVSKIVGKPREMNGQHKTGETFPMNLAVSEIVQNGKVTYISVVRDVSKDRKNEEEIRRLAFYDPLTGLPNRRLLVDRLQQALITSTRTGQHGAVMFLDLDHFKLLNDSLGHHVGDELLTQVAERLRLSVREGDSVARLGGDEFVVLLESLSIHLNEAANQAKAIGEKIIETLGQEYQLIHHTYSSTPSIGIVVFMENNETVEELLRRADVAMYQAKAAGRNTLRFFDPAMQAAVAEHAELEKDIRIGLVRNEFSLHYQIQVNRDGECIGAEALLRWQHRTRGMVSPAQFIPLAEETGVILPLGQWVMETACKQLVEWSHDPGKAHWSIAVNVSASQFAQPQFVDEVASAVRRTGANPNLLKLELTESMLVKDIGDIINKMNVIKGSAVGFSLDDFGTGYSSLAYLKKLPLNQLKIDQSFVRDIMTDPSDAVIARTVIALGHSLGLSVIAEGVETIEQRDFLHANGCDAFQGYLFGRPSPAAKLNAPTLTELASCA